MRIKSDKKLNRTLNQILGVLWSVCQKKLVPKIGKENSMYIRMYAYIHKNLVEYNERKPKMKNTDINRKYKKQK